LRVCVVYDCLYPHTVGGGERWYRNLAERLSAEGHDVTYLTLRQWARGASPQIDGVRVAVAGPRMELYANGRRRIVPPLVFGAGVFWHLLRRGRVYDVVHCSSFPYFSLLAAALLRRLCGYDLVVDWLEVWSREYWREYLGRAARAGVAVQRRCARVRQRAFCLSELHAARLRAAGLRGEVTVLRGLLSSSVEAEEPLAAEPLVVFAGRLIPEKSAPAVVDAVALAAERIPGLHGIVFGDGPDREAVHERIAQLSSPEVVSAPGFVDGDAVHAALRRACCLLLPSRREGYGLVVVEAAAVGTPAILVSAPDNAAVELIEEGVNGTVVPSAQPEVLADAIEAVWAGGPPLRAATAAWFARNRERLSIESSLEAVVESYAALRSARGERGR